MNNNKFEITIGGWACQALGIVFVTLKLMHYIDWSWWWVFSPLWIPTAILLTICIIVALIYLAAVLINLWK